MIFSNKTQFLQLSLTVIILAAVFFLSWLYLSDHKKTRKEEEKKHSLLKVKFQEALFDLVQKKHPEISKITFNRVWTKKTNNPLEVEIRFIYSLNLEGETGGDTELEGSAVLSLVENNLWQIQNFQIEQNRLQFSDPLLIKAKTPTNNKQDNSDNNQPASDNNQSLPSP